MLGGRQGVNQWVAQVEAVVVKRQHSNWEEREPLAQVKQCVSERDFCCE